MGFFGTVWVWIKRLLFIACMALTSFFAIFLFLDDTVVKNALSVSLSVVIVLLAIGNCVLYFLFSQDRKWMGFLGLFVQLALILVVGFGCKSPVTNMGMLTNFVAILIHIGEDGFMKIHDFIRSDKTELKAKMKRFVFGAGLIIGLAAGIYQLIFNK